MHRRSNRRKVISGAAPTGGPIRGVDGGRLA